MLENLTLFIAMKVLRLFYSPMEVANDRLSKCSPSTLFVLNHPNGAVDAMIMSAVLGKPVTFLAKSTPFGYPTSRWFVRGFGALPIYRVKDIGLKGGASDRDDLKRRNEETFSKCRAILESGNSVALFPEGTSHSEPMLMPMKTGAARIVFSAAEEYGWEKMEIMPVGLWYENPTRFRSAMLVVPGESIKVKDFKADYQEDSRKAVLELTETIEKKLHEVVLQAETTELLRAAPFIAAWTDPEGRKPDLPTRQARAAALLEDYEKLYKADPDSLAEIDTAVRRYARLLNLFGVKDPWKLEDPRPLTGYALRRLLILLLWSPFALIGVIMSYIPYRFSPKIVRHGFRENRTKAGGLKMAVGTILVVIFWILEAVTVGIFFGAAWGVGLAVMAPVCGFFALRWSEVARKLREVVRAHWMRWRKEHLVNYLKSQRQALADKIHHASNSLQAQ